MPDTARDVDELQRFALSLPEAWPDTPWDGDPVAKVGKKIFAFLPAGATPHLTVKLPDSGDHALSVPGASPTGYGLGRHGWCTVPVGTAEAPLELLLEWIEESYRTVAPKKLIAKLDAAPDLH